MRRLCFFALLLLGCPKTTTEPLVPAPESPLGLVSLSAPVAMSPGTLSLGVKIDGDGASQSLRVLVRKPGAVMIADGGQWLSPGVAPAGGPAWYLQADGSFGAAVPEPRPATSGTVDLRLDAEGQWQVFAQVVGESGDVRSQAGTRVVVSSKPAVALSVNRLVANSDDPVRAQLTLVAGAAPQDVRLVAWLQGADGGTRLLPNADHTGGALYVGPAANLELPVLGRSLETGTYELHALLFDAQSTLLGLASAGLQVCDEPGTVSGTVSSGGTVVIGEKGRVLLRDVADDALESVEVQPDGSFTTPLPAGDYLAEARLQGRAGSARVPVHVNCGAVAQVALDAPAERLAGSSSGLTRRQALETVRRGHASLYALAAREPETLNDSMLKLLLFTFAERVDNGSTALEVTTPADIAAVLMVEELNQRLGGDDVGTLNALSNKHYDFVLSLKASKLGSDVQFTGHLIDPATQQVIWSDARRAPAGSSAMVDAVQALGDSLLRVAGLEAQLERLQDWPVHPLLTLGVVPTEVVVGKTFRVTGLLTEKTDHRPEPGKTVELGAGAERQTLVTDAQGLVNFEFTAPTTPGTVRVTSTYTRRGADYGEDKVVTVKPEGKLVLSFEEALMAIEDSIRVDVMISDDALKANQPVQFTATGGRLDIATAITDANGHAAVQFTADGTDLMPVITATAVGSAVSGQELVRPACHAGVCPAGNDPTTRTRLIETADPSSTVSDGSGTLVVADLRVANAAFADLPISFSLTGAGRLENAAAATDADGLAQVKYLAPMNGTGEDTVRARVRVAGGLIEQSLVLHYQPSCPTCPVTITGPGSVAKGGRATLTANLPVRWSWSGVGSLDARGAFTAGLSAGKAVITATTVDLPARTATHELWVSCERKDLLGSATGPATFQVTYSNLMTAANYTPCIMGNTGQLVLSAYASDMVPSHLDFTLYGASMQGCRQIGSNPLFANLGDQCDVRYSATDLPGLTCGGLHLLLQPSDNTLKTLKGTMSEDDVTNGCGVGLSTDVSATRP